MPGQFSLCLRITNISYHVKPPFLTPHITTSAPDIFCLFVKQRCIVLLPLLPPFCIRRAAMAPTATTLAAESEGNAALGAMGKTVSGKKLRIRSYPTFDTLEEERLYRKQHLAAAFRVYEFISPVTSFCSCYIYDSYKNYIILNKKTLKETIAETFMQFRRPRLRRGRRRTHLCSRSHLD